jgi:hypothetical protein
MKESVKDMSNNSGCCSCGSSNCCTPEVKRKEITIEFLYLDLSVCERCQGTETNLDLAVKEVSDVLSAAGFDIKLNKVNITSEEIAQKYRFVSSPTIRVNGRDIDLNVKETSCKECGDLCGDDVDCRVWEYEGVEYNEPPKAMIINAIMKEVYGSSNASAPESGEYILPENLKTFFKGIQRD